MNALTPISTAAGENFCARVIRRDGPALIVEREGEALAARRAVSCLVEVEAGDLVLLGGPVAQPYVLAVLERSGAAPVRLAVAGDVELAAEGGRLTLRGEELAVDARRGQVMVDDLTVTGAKVAGRFGAVSLVADALESLVTRLLTRAKRSYRIVEEMDQLRAEHIDHRAAGHLNLRGQTAVLHAGVVVKLDAAQIHMG